MSADAARPVEMFISYAHEDEAFARKLRSHLSTLQRQNVVSSWYDRDISAGEDRAARVAEQLGQATIIVLLVSSDFLASDYCYGVEVQGAMERYQRKEACVVPVIVRSCDWRGTPFDGLQELPRDGKPIKKWDDEDEAFLAVIDGIREVLCRLQADPSYQAYLNREAPARVVVENIPYARNLMFTGREEVLAQLYQELHQEQAVALTQAISGLGGIGKTQTALEYAHRYRDEYTHILWITAETLQDVRAALSRIALLLKLPLGPEQEQAVIIEAVKRWLQQHDGWLLILDNVERFEDLEGLPPRQARGHTLITTRSQAIGHRARHVDLATMALDEGALFLLRRANLLNTTGASLAMAPEADQTIAREIAQELGGLPLALDQAGAYIEETQCGLQGYLDLYRRRNADLLQERGESEEDYPETVATTWSLSFEKVQKASPVASDFLAVCALLDPDAIPRTLFDQGAQALGPELRQLQGDELAFNAMMRNLLRYSLLRRNPDQTLTIHRLVQIVLQSRMNQQELRLWSERVVKVVVLSLPPTDYEQDHWSQCLEYVPQVQRALELIEQQQFTFVEAAGLLHWLGKVLYEQARYQKAALLLQRSLTVGEQIVGPEHSLVATILNDLAELYRQQAKYQVAEPLYLRALQICEKILGESDPETATSLNNLARGYHSQAKYEKAEPYYQRALQTREQMLGERHAETATSLNDLAVLYQDQGRYEEAESLYEQALQIREEVLGGQHPETATSLNNLAALYQAQGRYAEAEPLRKRALQIREEVLGGQHPETATSLTTLAALYQAQGRYAEAEPLRKRALQIREEVLGGQHPSTATSLTTLAALYQEQGRYAEVEPLLKRALQVREEVLGGQHPDTAASLTTLAALYQAQGRYGEAEPLYERALQISEEVLGGQHPDTATSLNDLAALYQAQGRYAEAEPLYERALQIQEEVLGGQHPYTATSLGNLAGLYKDQGRLQAALVLYKRALAIWEHAVGAQHPSTATSLGNLAALYQAQGRYAEAEPLYERALQIREEVLGGQHPSTATSLTTLAALYQEQGRYGEAKPLYERALQIQEEVLGGQHPDTAMCLNNLATLYVRRNLYSLALPLLKRSLAIWESVLGAKHPYTQLVRKNYEDLRARMRPAGGGRKKKKR